MNRCSVITVTYTVHFLPFEACCRVASSLVLVPRGLTPGVIHAPHDETKYSRWRPQSRGQSMTSTLARIWITSEVFFRYYVGIQSPGVTIRLASETKGVAERSYSIATAMGCEKEGHDEDVKGVSCKFL